MFAQPEPAEMLSLVRHLAVKFLQSKDPAYLAGRHDPAALLEEFDEFASGEFRRNMYMAMQHDSRGPLLQLADRTLVLLSGGGGEPQYGPRESPAFAITGANQGDTGFNMGGTPASGITGIHRR